MNSLTIPNYNMVKAGIFGHEEGESIMTSVGKHIYWKDTDIISVRNKDCPSVTVEHMMEQVETIKILSKDRHLPLIADGKGLQSISMKAIMFSFKEQYWGSLFCAAGVKPSNSKGWKKFNNTVNHLMETWNDKVKKTRFGVFSNIFEAFHWSLEQKNFPYHEYVKEKLDEDDLEILKYLFNGLSSQDLGEKLNFTKEKIAKRIRKSH